MDIFVSLRSRERQLQVDLVDKRKAGAETGGVTRSAAAAEANRTTIRIRSMLEFSASRLEM
jgi:hypothetical protein